MVDLTPIPNRSFQWGPKVTANFEALNAAKTEAAEVQTIADAAAEAKFVEVVANPNDSAVAALVETPASATATALNSTYPNLAGTDSPITLKPEGDARPGVFEWEHKGSAGYIFHLMARAGFSGGALLGVGLEADAGAGSGVLISMKSPSAAQVGLDMADRSNVNAGSKLIKLFVQNTTGARGLEINQSGSGAGAALFVQGAVGVPASQRLIEWVSGAGTSMVMKAASGVLEFSKGVDFYDVSGGNSAKPRLHLTAMQSDASSTDVNHTYISDRFTEYRTWAGAAGTFFPKRVLAESQSLKFQFANTLAGGPTATATWYDALEVKGNGSTPQIGFFGKPAVSRPAAIADATDAATAISQLNLGLAALRTLGLIAT